MGMTIDEAIHDTEVMKDRQKVISILSKMLTDNPFKLSGDEVLAVRYAISSLKTDEAYQIMYEGGEIFIKADLVAMLEELKKEIEEQCKIPNNNASAYDWNNGVYACHKAVQSKIDKLKGK